MCFLLVKYWDCSLKCVHTNAAYITVSTHVASIFTRRAHQKDPYVLTGLDSQVYPTQMLSLKPDKMDVCMISSSCKSSCFMTLWFRTILHPGHAQTIHPSLSSPVCYWQLTMNRAQLLLNKITNVSVRTAETLNKHTVAD